LDHEQHDMSEYREFANADMQQAIPGVGDPLEQARYEVSR
jgi:hypothetical protein